MKYILSGLAVIGTVLGVLGIMALVVWLGVKYVVFGYIVVGLFLIIMLLIIAYQIGYFVNEG